MAASTTPPVSTWQRALNMLRRPAAPSLPPEEVQPRRKGEISRATWAQQQAEIEVVLWDMATERQNAEVVIASTGERREALLMLPDSDDAILSLQTEMEKAQLVIERLDRVEPDLYQRLGNVKFHARNERWETVRDKFAPIFESFQEAQEEYLSVYSSYLQAREDCAAAFPERDVLDVLPEMPHLVMNGSRSYHEGLAFFRVSQIVLEQSGRPLLITMQAFIDHAAATGEIPDICPLEWRAQIEQALKPTTYVTLTASFTDTSGEYYKKGDRIELPTEAAMQMVRNGRAYSPGASDGFI